MLSENSTISYCTSLNVFLTNLNNLPSPGPTSKIFIFSLYSTKSDIIVIMFLNSGFLILGYVAVWVFPLFSQYSSGLYTIIFPPKNFKTFYAVIYFIRKILLATSLQPLVSVISVILQFLRIFLYLDFISFGFLKHLT